jgi:hypothetical protein
MGVLGPADGGVVGYGALAGGVLVLSRSTRLPCVARAESRRERGEGLGKNWQAQRRGGAHSWGKAKTDGGGTKADGAGCVRLSGR